MAAFAFLGDGFRYPFQLDTAVIIYIECYAAYLDEDAAERLDRALAWLRVRLLPKAALNSPA